MQATDQQQILNTYYLSTYYLTNGSLSLLQAQQTVQLASQHPADEHMLTKKICCRC